jgi:hypothetical protein
MAGVSSVFVIEGDKARQQRVTLGVHQGRSWEVVDGIKGTEVLASSNLNQLATGTRVRPDDETAPSQSLRGGGE